jgi:hypothetical protein
MTKAAANADGASLWCVRSSGGGGGGECSSGHGHTGGDDNEWRWRRRRARQLQGASRAVMQDTRHTVVAKAHPSAQIGTRHRHCTHAPAQRLRRDGHCQQRGVRTYAAAATVSLCTRAHTAHPDATSTVVQSPLPVPAGMAARLSRCSCAAPSLRAWSPCAHAHTPAATSRAPCAIMYAHKQLGGGEFSQAGEQRRASARTMQPSAPAGPRKRCRRRPPPPQCRTRRCRAGAPPRCRPPPGSAAPPRRRRCRR